MKELFRNIQIIYTAAQKDIAEHIGAYLQEHASQLRTAQNAAVIIVSDEAAADQEWQKEVRALPASMRLVPCGAIVNADYNDPEVIPPKIEELNFIRIDESLNENILDSLLLDKDFYEIRNAVQVNMNAWLLAGETDSFLISDYGKAKKYLRAIDTKLTNENDERFIEQLHQMKDYLTESRTYARKIFYRTLRSRITVALLAVIFVLFAIAAWYLINTIQRAARESALLGQKTTEAKAAETFILLSDGIDNPLIDGYTRGALFNQMTETLDYSWTTTPTGYNYKYRLYDPKLLNDERYLMTVSENHEILIWDTWTGKINESFSSGENDTKAYHVDGDNGVVIAVNSENVIYFGDAEAGQWLTNNVQYPFTGNTDIHILSAPGQIIIYDDANVFFFGTDPLRLVSYITEETMAGSTYKIHSVFVNENGPALAHEINNEMCFYYRNENGELTGYNTGTPCKEDCTAAVYETYMVFADPEGNITVLDKESKEFFTVGLKLPDVRFLTCINDSVFAYYDSLKGTHLYDFRQGIDLGTVLSGFEDISYLGAGKYTIFCYADGAWHCQYIDHLLPVTEIDEGSVLQRFTDTSPAGQEYMKNISYTDQLVRFTFCVNGNEQKYILDGGHRRYTGGALSDPYSREENTHVFDKQPLSWSGDVTVLGTMSDGLCLLVGTDDGQFREISLDYDGTWYEDTYLQLPSHSAVTEIIETEDCYLIKDAAGNYWQAEIRCRTHSGEENLLDRMNEKVRMHGYFTQELLDSVSEQLKKDIRIGLMPGGDGKEWE